MSVTIDSSLVGVGSDPIRGFFGPAIKQRFDCTKTKLESGVIYAAVKLPKGFVPRNICVNVLTAGASGQTLSVGTNKEVSAAQVVFNSALAVSAVGPKLVDAGKSTATSTAVADGGGTPTITVASGKTIVSDDETYVTIAPSADLTTAIFDVIVTGDFMLGDWDKTVDNQWPQ